MRERTQFCLPSASHQLNSRLANTVGKPGPGQYLAKDLTVTLEQNDAGDWLLRINRGMPMPATDVEVSLWLRLQAALRADVK